MVKDLKPDTHTKGESNDRLVIGWHQNVQIGKRCFQVVLAHSDMVLVLIPYSRLFVENSKLNKDIIEPKVGNNECGVRVVVSAKIDFTAFFNEVFDSEKRYIATERGRGIVCSS